MGLSDGGARPSPVTSLANKIKQHQLFSSKTSVGIDRVTPPGSGILMGRGGLFLRASFILGEEGPGGG